ncbi:MAG: DUF6485 family protein [Candidatus Omnitrophota bacterium]
MAKKCYNRNENKEGCPCTYEPCDKKGVCCECLKYHLSMKELPACVFSEEAERTYDRSIANFIKTQK